MINFMTSYDFVYLRSMAQLTYYLTDIPPQIQRVSDLPAEKRNTVLS